MLINRIVGAAGAFRRRPEIPVDLTTWSSPSYGNAGAYYNTFSTTWYASYYPYEAFDGVPAGGWCWSYTNDILTTSIDTTVWLDIYPGQAIVLDAIDITWKRAMPTTLQIYGSNTGAFTAADRVLVLSQALSVDGITGEEYSTGWIQKTAPNAYFKYYRMYLLGPQQWLPAVSDFRFPQILEMQMRTSSNILDYDMKAYLGLTSGWTITASSGTASNAFSTSVYAWIPNSAGAPNNDWLQVVFPASGKRYFSGWRTRAYNSSSGVYGRGAPSTYSLYYSLTGEFAGEEICLADGATFNKAGMSSSMCYSPWHDDLTVIGPIRGLRWVFNDWDFLDTGYTNYGGPTSIILSLSQSQYS
jgi:hypothetical protein